MHLEPGLHMRAQACRKLGRVLRHEMLEETHARSHERVVVRIPLVVANGSAHDQDRGVRRARAHQEAVVGMRQCVDAAIALATVSMALRSAVASVSASLLAKGCNSRRTGSGLSLLVRRVVTTLFWILLERPRKGTHRDAGTAAGPCSTAGAAGSCDRKRIVASSCKWRTRTNRRVMPSVYLGMSCVLNMTSNWPKASRLGDRDVAQRVDLVNCKLPAPCLDRPERHARLGKACVEGPMLPQSVCGPEHHQLLSQCLSLHVLVVVFPPPLGHGSDVGAAAA